MISLGFCGETMKSAAMTLSHSPCHSATFISPSCLPPSTSHPLVSSPPLFNSSWGKFIDSPLFACHLHIFNCHDREHSSLKWWSRVRVRAISCPGFLKNETPWHLFVFSSIWAKKKMPQISAVGSWKLWWSGGEQFGDTFTEQALKVVVEEEEKKVLLLPNSAHLQIQGWKCTVISDCRCLQWWFCEVVKVWCLL